jgi:hypothetical protein
MRCCAVIDTNVIVAALLSKKDDAYLVTGNSKHYPIKDFIVTPAEMLEILKKNMELS